MKRLLLLLILPLSSLAQPVVIGNTHMLSPAGVAVGTTKVYVANTAGVVTVFDMSGTFVEEIGTRGNGPGQLAYPYSVDIDAAGNIYVGDGENLRIEVFAPNGSHVRSINGGFGSGGNPVSLGVRIGTDGNLYVLDPYNRIVKVFTTTGTLIRTIGAPGTGDGKFQTVLALALDASDNVYVTDWYFTTAMIGRIQKFDNLGNYISNVTANAFFPGVSVNSNGRIYAPDGNGSVIRYYDQPTGSGTIGIVGQGGKQGQFMSAQGVDISSTNDVFICDFSNNRVQVFNVAGAFVREFGSGLSGVGQLKVPLSADVDAGGKIYVADAMNNRVQVFNADGTFSSIIGSSGPNDDQFNGAYTPRGVKVDAAGNIYALTTGRVKIFASNGTYTRYVGEFGTATHQISTATCGPYLHGSKIIIGDFGGYVKAFDNATGNHLLTFGQSGLDSEQIDYTYDVAADDDYYYVADGLRIQVYSNTGVFVKTLSIGKATAVEVANGKLYVSLDQGVKVFDINGILIGGYGGPGTGTGRFVNPGKITVKGNTLLVSDLTRVQKFDLTTDLRAAQTITFAAIPFKTYGIPAFDLAATASSTLTVTYKSSNPNVATISGSTVTIIGAGNTTITATQAGDATFFQALATQVLTVNKATPVITVAAVPNKILGDAAFNITASSPSPAAILYTSLNSAVATVNTTGTVTIVGAGLAAIRMTQGSDTNYDAPSAVTVQFTVAQTPQTVTFDELAPVTYGDAAFTLTATASSGLPVTFASNNLGIASISGNTVTIVGAGTVDIYATQVGDNQYAPKTEIRSLVVNKKAQTITFAALADKTYGDAPFALTATSSSSLAVTYTTDNSLIADVSGAQLSIIGTGTVKITASQPGNSNFLAATQVERTLVINKKAQTLSFTSPADKTMGDPAFVLTATSTSGLPIIFTSTSDKITIASSTVTVSKAGRATITASQSGNFFYLAAASVDQSFCIRPATPTITSTVASDGTLTLTSSNATGNQWFNGASAIANATTQTFSATQAGQYFVKTTVDDCESSLSAGFAVVVTASSNAVTENELTVFPNPAIDEVVVMLQSGVTVPVSLKVVNAMGAYQHSAEGMTNQPIAIDVRSWGTGVFVVKAVVEEVVVMRRMIKR